MPRRAGATLEVVRTVVLGERPPELQELIERRRRLGLDLHDEIWEGEYHMSPAASVRHAFLESQLTRILGPLADAVGLLISAPFNLGEPDDFRVPDLGVHRGMPTGVWVARAALAVEILSPDDESWAKLGFYARLGVEEVLVVDPDGRRLTWLVRNEAGDGYDETERSALLDVDVAPVAAAINWPASA